MSVDDFFAQYETLKSQGLQEVIDEGAAAYALLSGQGAPWTAYLADLAMGTATGGIIGAIVSNISGK